MLTATDNRRVAFAFCHLLGFQLLSRLKAIPKQKLDRPETGQPEEYPRLAADFNPPDQLGINRTTIRPDG